MRKTTIAALLMLACAASLLFAQSKAGHTPPDPATIAQHRVSFLTTVLSLPPAQQASATTIFTNAATTASGLRAQMKTAHQSLMTAVQNNDTAAINSQSTTIGALVSQMVSAKASANAAFYQLLTPDQQTKFKELQSEHRRWGFKEER